MDTNKNDPEMTVGITDLGIAYIEWVDSRPPPTEGVRNLIHYGEFAAFCAGWRAGQEALQRKE